MKGKGEEKRTLSFSVVFVDPTNKLPPSIFKSRLPYIKEMLLSNNKIMLGVRTVPLLGLLLTCFVLSFCLPYCNGRYTVLYYWKVWLKVKLCGAVFVDVALREIIALSGRWSLGGGGKNIF